MSMTSAAEISTQAVSAPLIFEAPEAGATPCASAAPGRSTQPRIAHAPAVNGHLNVALLGTLTPKTRVLPDGPAAFIPG